LWRAFCPEAAATFPDDRACGDQGAYLWESGRDAAQRAGLADRPVHPAQLGAGHRGVHQVRLAADAWAGRGVGQSVCLEALTARGHDFPSAEDHDFQIAKAAPAVDRDAPELCLELRQQDEHHLVAGPAFPDDTAAGSVALKGESVGPEAPWGERADPQ